MSTWLLNISGTDYTPAALKLAIVGGEWVSGSASSVTLQAKRKFDASELFNYGAAVILKRDGAAYFRGKCQAIPKGADGGSEAQGYIIQDAWADLEKLTYQEPWLVRKTGFTGNAAAYSPRVVLGLDSSGTRISTSQQVAEVISFAASMGVAIQLGSIPTGMMLWPEEVNSQSCAQVIRTSLRYHLDWIPWLNHATSPPTLNITPRGSASTVTLDLSGGSKIPGFNITKTYDRVPTGVRIIYKSCHVVDDKTYRSYEIDQAPAPTGSALAIRLAKFAAAPIGMLVTEVELAGQQVPVQKQQVTVREMPDNQTAAVAYLKLKFPVIKDVGTFTVDQWDLSVLDPSETSPTLDELLIRQQGTGLSGANGLKNELVDGAVPDWTQRRVGTVLVKLKVTAGGGMSEDNKNLLQSLPPWFTVTATNAVNKIYRGVSSFTPADSIPSGVAAAYLQTLQSGCDYEGSIPTIETDVGATRWHGSALNLTGGETAWETMAAPIHSVSWDLRSRKTMINFGPNPDFGVQEYIEFLRNLSKRENRTYTTEERTGDELGSENGISGRGDSVGPTTTPQTVTGGGAGGVEFSHPFKITTSVVSDVPKYKVSKGSILKETNGVAATLTGVFDVDRTASAGFVVLSTTVADGEVDNDAWALSIVPDASAAADTKEVKMNTEDPPTQEKIRLLLGRLTVEAGVAKAWQCQFTSVRIGTAILNGAEVKVLDPAPTAHNVV